MCAQSYDWGRDMQGRVPASTVLGILAISTLCLSAQQHCCVCFSSHPQDSEAARDLKRLLTASRERFDSTLRAEGRAKRAAAVAARYGPGRARRAGAPGTEGSDAAEGAGAGPEAEAAAPEGRVPVGSAP